MSVVRVGNAVAAVLHEAQSNVDNNTYSDVYGDSFRDERVNKKELVLSYASLQTCYLSNYAIPYFLSLSEDPDEVTYLDRLVLFVRYIGYSVFGFARPKFVERSHGINRCFCAIVC